MITTPEERVELADLATTALSIICGQCAGVGRVHARGRSVKRVGPSQICTQCEGAGAPKRPRVVVDADVIARLVVERDALAVDNERLRACVRFYGFGTDFDGSRFCEGCGSREGESHRFFDKNGDWGPGHPGYRPCDVGTALGERVTEQDVEVEPVTFQEGESDG